MRRSVRSLECENRRGTRPQIQRRSPYTARAAVEHPPRSKAPSTTAGQRFRPPGQRGHPGENLRASNRLEAQREAPRPEAGAVVSEQLECDDGCEPFSSAEILHDE